MAAMEQNTIRSGCGRPPGRGKAVSARRRSGAGIRETGSRCGARRFRRAHGTVRLGQDHAVEPDRRARPADQGSIEVEGRGSTDCRTGSWHAGAPTSRLRVPDVQPAAGAHRRAQRRIAAAADETRARRAPKRVLRHCRWWVSATASSISRASCPAARSSASASRAPS